jgi:molybdopterin-binding protein
MPRLYTPREAADMLGIGYGSLERRLYQGNIKSIQTPGGHHRIPDFEIDRLLPRNEVTDTPELIRRIARSVSARNQLIGRITDIKIVAWSLSSDCLSGAGQHITSIISTDEVRKLRLKKGQTAIALINSPDVTIMPPD